MNVLKRRVKMKCAGCDAREKELETRIDQTNLARGRLTAWVFLAMEIIILLVTLTVKSNSLRTVYGRRYIMMYLGMILAMSVFLCVFVYLRKDVPGHRKAIQITGICFLSFILSWCAGISLLDQRFSGQIMVYIFAVIAVAVVPYFKPRTMLPIYVLIHTAFVILLIYSQRGNEFPYGNVVNSTTFVIMAGVISAMRYYSYLSLLNSQGLVQKKNLQLEKLNLELQEANKKLEKLSQTDGLTGLLNRTAFDRILCVEWDRCKRHQMPLSMIMVDIDLFKAFNDTYGHQEGDHCLREVTKLLARSARRASDSVARYGGEEFAVILPCMGAGKAAELAELMRKRVEALAIPHAASFVSTHVTISLGVYSSFLPNDLTVEAFIGNSDMALYKSKELRNQVAVYQDGDAAPMYYFPLKISNVEQQEQGNFSVPKSPNLHET